MGIDDVDRRFTRPKPREIKREPAAPGDLCSDPRCGGHLGYPMTMDMSYGGARSGKLACLRCHNEPRDR